MPFALDPYYTMLKLCAERALQATRILHVVNTGSLLGKDAWLQFPCCRASNLLQPLGTKRPRGCTDVLPRLHLLAAESK